MDRRTDGQTDRWTDGVHASVLRTDKKKRLKVEFKAENLSLKPGHIFLLFISP